MKITNFAITASILVTLTGAVPLPQGDYVITSTPSSTPYPSDTVPPYDVTRGRGSRPHSIPSGVYPTGTFGPAPTGGFFGPHPHGGQGGVRFSSTSYTAAPYATPSGSDEYFQAAEYTGSDGVFPSGASGPEPTGGYHHHDEHHDEHDHSHPEYGTPGGAFPSGSEGPEPTGGFPGFHHGGEGGVRPSSVAHPSNGTFSGIHHGGEGGVRPPTTTSDGVPSSTSTFLNIHHGGDGGVRLPTTSSTGYYDAIPSATPSGY